ncbi:tetratricopeptide repeat protein [Methylocaldum sp. GT1BB]|uniref:tetratricopeptide repeat protein n=1 Tax=Methylocaldum sp. GT1BB TaxID=3438963 RepID=UPI003DA02891
MKFRLTRPVPAWVVVAWVLTACGGAEERKAAHLARGLQYVEAQNLDKAKVEFKNVLQIDPKAASPYFYLGRIEEDQKHWREAFALYQKAVELDPTHRDAQLKLAKFYLLAKDAAKAQELLGPVAEERPSDLEVRMLKAAIANLQGDSASMRAQLEAIVAEQPARPDPYLVLALHWAQQGQPAEAIGVLETGLKIQPNQPALLMALARLHQQQGQAEAAEETLKALIAAQPDRLEHRGLLTELYLKQRRFDAAEATLRTAQKDFPEDPRAPLWLAEFFVKRGDGARAVSELTAVIAARPTLTALRFGLAQVHQQLGEADQAESVYRALIADHENQPDGFKAMTQLAELLAKRGRSDEARDLVKQVLAENPKDHPALSLEGRLALARREAQDAIAAFRALLKDQPESTEVLTRLAQAYLLDGKPALAQEQLDKAVAVNPADYRLRKLLVEFLVGQKNPSLALDKLNEFLKQQPKHLDGLNLKADLLVASQQTDALEPLLKEIKDRFPDKAVGPFRLGQLYQSRKQPEAALAEYETALSRAQNDYEPLKAIVGLHLAAQQPEKALARIRKALKDDPKHPTAHQLLGLYHLARNQETEAIQAFERAIEIHPQWRLPYHNLAAVHEQKKDLKGAAAAYRRALAAAPEDRAARMGLARVLERSKDWAGAMAEYEAVLARNPNDALARNNLAALLSLDAADRDKLQRALALAQRFETATEPAFLDTLGWIYRQLGELTTARGLLEKAVAQAPEVPIFQYHLGMVYLQAGDKALAKERLEKAVVKDSDYLGLEEAKQALAGVSE